MAGYRRANYYELCRLCTSSEGTKVHVFREEGQRRQLLTKIQICLPLQVLEGDSLPNIICMDCVERLESFYDFREACVNAEAMLESYFSSLRFNEDFRKTGKCYVKEVPKKKELVKAKMPLETLVKPDINITRVEPIISHVEQVEVEDDEPIETEEVQQFEFVVDDEERPSEEDMQKSQEVENQILMEFDFIKDKDDSPSKSDDGDRSSMDQIGEFLRIKPMSTSNLSPDDISEDSNNCNRCNKRFFSSQELNEHECGGVQISIVPAKSQNPTDEACYLCEVCSRPFRRKEHLIQHSKLHTGERPYPCTTCGKTFSRKEHLVRHSTCHTGEKTHECDICGKSFSRRDNLLKHRKTHGVGGPFVCDICGKNFTMKHYYLMHLSTHSSETPEGNPKPFKCDTCQKTFAVRQYLLNHMARHRNPAPKSDGAGAVTVELPSADETVKSLAEQSANYVQLADLPSCEEAVETLSRNSFVQIVALKVDQNEACV